MTTPFTTFLPATCAGLLTALVTACAISAQPAVALTGPLRWSFAGSLAPGAELTVTFRVKVDQHRANGKVIARFPIGTQRHFGQLKFKKNSAKYASNPDNTVENSYKKHSKYLFAWLDAFRRAESRFSSVGRSDSVQVGSLKPDRQATHSG